MSKMRGLIRKLIQRLPNRLRRDIVLAGIAAGEGLEGYFTYPSMDCTFRYLRRKGFRPGFAIDVGAFRGEWTCEFKAVFPESRILMIEPQQSKQTLLKSVASRFGMSVDLEDSLLGAQQGVEVMFHDMEQGSSVFKEQSYIAGSPTTRKLATLDSVLGQLKISDNVDLLKLDTQGYELEVLKGAEKALKRTEFVLLETSLIAINEGCPLVLEVLEFMADRGFQLFDICGQWRRPDHFLWQIDLLLIHKRSPLVPVPTLDGPSFSGWRI